MTETEEKLNVSQNMWLKRSKRIEEQIRGIEKMIVQDRDCVNIFT